MKESQSPIKSRVVISTMSKFSKEKPNSDCITFFPTENAPTEAPGLLELIWSVYCEFIGEGKHKKKSISLLKTYCKYIITKKDF